MLTKFTYPRILQTGTYNGRARSLKKSVMAQEKNAIISEIKPASPSQGLLNTRPARELAIEMQEAGACAISVLTEPRYFNGSLENLLQAKESCILPVIRKDFITDKLQMDEAKSFGADAVLLIAELLEDRTEEFVEHSHHLGLETIVETHSEENLQYALSSGTDLIGINNRDLETLEIDIGTTKRLAGKIDGIPIIAESGVSSLRDIRALKEHADAFLIGTMIMKAADIGKTIGELRCA